MINRWCGNIKTGVLFLTAVFSGVVPSHPGIEKHPLICIETVDKSSVSYNQGKLDAIHNISITVCVNKNKVGNELIECVTNTREIFSNYSNGVSND